MGYRRKYGPFISPSEIKVGRAQFNLTQNELAKKLGVSNGSVISKWEKGVSTPSVECTQKMLELFGLDKTAFNLATSKIELTDKKDAGLGLPKLKPSFIQNNEDMLLALPEKPTENIKPAKKLKLLYTAMAAVLMVQTQDLAASNLDTFKKLQGVVLTLAEAIEQYEA